MGFLLVAFLFVKLFDASHAFSGDLRSMFLLLGFGVSILALVKSSR